MPTKPDQVSARYEAQRAAKPRVQTKIDLSLSLIDIRRLLDMTQEQFAQALKVAAPYVSMLESGKRTPSPALLQNIAGLVLSKAGRTQDLIDGTKP